MTTTFKGALAVLFAALVWGTTGTAASLAPEVGAAAIGAAAMGLGGLAQALIHARRIRQARAALARHKGLLALGAVAVAIYPLAFYGSMRLAGVTIGTVITIGSAPLWSAFLEMICDKARLGAQWKLGAALGLAGMALISFSHHDSAIGGAPVAGVLLGLLAGLSYAAYSWSARKIMLTGVPSPAVMGATFGLGGLLLLPVLFATGAPLVASWGNFAVGAYMAVVPMFLGYLAFGYGLARLRASMATTITLFEPVVAALLAVTVVGERLAPSGWLGVGLIIACLVLITLPARLFAPQPSARLCDSE